MSSNNEKVWAVSTEPGSRQIPAHVSKRLVGTPGWKVQKMKVIADPHAEPVPFNAPSPSLEREAVKRLEREKAELQAKLDELMAGTAQPERGKPGRKPKATIEEQTQA